MGSLKSFTVYYCGQIANLADQPGCNCSNPHLRIFTKVLSRSDERFSSYSLFGLHFGLFSDFFSSLDVDNILVILVFLVSPRGVTGSTGSEISNVPGGWVGSGQPRLGVAL